MTPAAPGTVVAIDLGGTKVSAALVERTGRVRRRLVEPVDRSSRLAPVDQIVRLVRALAGTGRLPAVGVAVPGLVRRTGTVWAPNLPGWEAMPLARLLKRRLRARLAVESDRNAAVLGEAWRGAARGAADAIVLIVGTGIGAGILSGGAIVRGAHELSGCAGWMAFGESDTADADRARRCGQLEAAAAGPGIAARAADAIAAGAASRLGGVDPAILSAQDVAAAAREGDTLAREVFEETGRLLGLAVANLISLFDPSVVVLGGGLAAASDLYLERLETTARAHAQPLAARQVRIRVSRLGADANLLGAARVGLGRRAARRRDGRSLSV